MKILAVTPTAGLSGVDQTFMQLCTGLSDKGHSIVAVLPQNAKISKTLTINSVSVISSNYLKWWFTPDFYDDYIKICTKNAIDSINELRLIICRIKPDLVFSNTSVFLDAYFAARITGIPHLTHLHALFVDNIYSKMSSEMKEDVYKLLSFGSSGIVVPAYQLKTDLSNLCVEHSKITVIPNGVDVKRFTPANTERKNKKFKILQLGHLNHNKNQIILIDVAKYLLEQGIDNFQFNLVGPYEKEYLNKLLSLISDNKLFEYFYIGGSTDQVVKLLQSSDIYVNSSITETFPVSVLEAQACGLPVVATSTTGANEIVRSGEDGYIVSNTLMMAKHLGDLIQNPSLLSEMGKNAREKVVKLFPLDNFIRKFEELMSSYTENTNRRSDKWIHSFFFRSFNEDGNGKNSIAIIVPDRTQPSFALLIDKPFTSQMANKNNISAKIFGIDEISSLKLEDFKLLYIFRAFGPLISNIVVQAINSNIPVVFETDDNYFDISFKDGEPVYKPCDNNDLKEIIEFADITIVYSDQMEHLSKKFSERVYQIKPYQITPSKLIEPGDSNIIGFMGTLKKDIDFTPVVPALKRIMAEYPEICVEFIGYIPKAMIGNPRVSHYDFITEYDKFINFFWIRKWLIALAPLADNAFNNSKTNNKYREYAAAGYAGIYSAVEPYKQCVKNRESGLLVKNTAEEWYSAIKLLLEDKTLRIDIVKKAFADVYSNYPFEQHCLKKFDLIKNLLGQVRNASLNKKLKLYWNIQSKEKKIRDVIELNNSGFIPGYFSKIKGKITGVCFIPIFTVQSGPGIFGVELIVGGTIKIQTSHLISNASSGQLLVINFESSFKVEASDIVEVRIFQRGGIGDIGVLGKKIILARPSNRNIPAIGIEIDSTHN